MPSKNISTLSGIIIILAAAAVCFGGVFAFQYFLIKTQPKAIVKPVSQKVGKINNNCAQRIENAELTKNFFVGNHYIVGPIGIERGIFNSDGTVLASVYTGDDFPQPPPKKYKWKWQIENGNLVINGELMGAIKDAKVYNSNGGIFAVLGTTTIGPSELKIMDFRQAQINGQCP